jgi:alpha-1,3-rhamnosyltransferase
MDGCEESLGNVMQSEMIVSIMASKGQMKDLPLVSVLMPAYNHEKFVEQAVKSVWDQTYANVELIVIDDGSSDNTLEILQALCAVSPISMMVHTQKNQGICRTLNSCFELSRGEWISLLASDDVYQNNFIGRMLAESRVNPKESSVFHCDAARIDEEGLISYRLSKVRKVPPYAGDSFLNIAYGRGFIISSTMFLSRRLYEIVGLFDPRLREEDFDIHLRLARVAQYIYIDEPLFLARKVRGSLGSRRHDWSNDIFLALEKHKDFLGFDYQNVVENRHKKLSVDFYSDRKLNYAFHHLCAAISNQSGKYKIIMVLQIMRAFAVATPRLIIFSLFPNSLINVIRNVKHKTLINQ